MPNGILTGEDYEDFRRLKKDMWYGNGKPGVTSRLDTLEGDVISIRLDQAAIRQDQKDINQKFWAIIILLIVAIVGAATDMVTHREAVQTQHSSMY